MLGDFVDFVGGPSHGHTLLVPLLTLTVEDETTVREQAVACARSGPHTNTPRIDACPTTRRPNGCHALAQLALADVCR